MGRVLYILICHWNSIYTEFHAIFDEGEDLVIDGKYMQVI